MELEDKLQVGKILSEEELKEFNLRNTGSFQYFEFYESDEVDLLILIKLLSYRESYEVKYFERVRP